VANNYTPEEVSSFVDEMTTQVSQYREARSVWRQAMDAQKAMRLANDPQFVSDAYASDPSKASDQVLANAAVDVLGGLLPGKLDKDKLGSIAEKAISTRRSQFTTELESAWTQHREEIPMEWWMQWSPSDVRLFGSPEMADIADHIEEIEKVVAQETAFQQRIEQITEQRWRARQNRGMWGFVQDLPGNLIGYGMTGRWDPEDQNADRRERNKIRAEVEAEMMDPLGKHEERIQERLVKQKEAFEKLLDDPDHPLYEQFTSEYGMTIDEALDYEERRIRQSISAGGDAGDILADKSLIHKGIDAGIGVIPWAFEKFDQGIEGVLWGIEALTPGSGTYDALRREYEQEQEEIKRQMAVLDGAPDEELMRSVRFLPLREVWQAMPQENPEQYELYMAMAGFDPTVAFAMFNADVSEDPDASAQMAEVVEQLRAEERQAIEDFEAADFRVSGQLLDLLASYGRNVPGRLSTYAALFLTDGDYFDDAIHARWGEFFSSIEAESEYFGHTPSAAIGIEGSLAGLLLDLGSGIAFDPLTWFFGPRGSSATLKGSSFANAEAIAKHPIVQQFTRDAARVVRSPSKGVAELLHISSWADSKFITELMDIVGWGPKKLPAQPWRATAGAEHAMEVETKFLSRLIPDDVRSAIDDAEIQVLADDILANGFKEYTSTTITRGDQMLFLDDGVKRVLAAEKAEVTHVPARLQIVDDFAAKPANLIDEAVDTATTDRIVRFGERVQGSADEVFRGSMNDGSELVIRQMVSKDPAKSGWFAYVDDVPVGGIERSNMGLLPAYGGRVKPVLDDGRSVAQALVDSAGPDVLTRLAQSDGLTQSAYSFLKKEAQRLGVSLPFDSPQGVNLDVFLKGSQTRKALKGAGAGNVSVRPDQFFPREMMLGQLDEAAIEAATRRAILRGKVPDGAYRSAIATQWNKTIRNAARTNKGTRWVERYLTPQNTVRRLELQGTQALDRLYETVFRVWGDDTIKADAWQTRIIEWQRRSSQATRSASERLQALLPVRQKLDELLDQIGGSPYPRGDGAERAVTKALRREYDDALRQFDTEMAAIDRQLAEQASTTQLANIVEEMWEDYNRTYLASNPAWKGVLDENGLVPWDELKKGSVFGAKKADQGIANEGARQFLSEDMQAVAAELGIDAEQLVQRLSSTLDQRMAVNVPVSPLELTIAREVGGAAYTRLTQRVSAALARDTFHGLNNAWKIDKVFRPATAITVSWDELMRDMHVFGAREGFMRWQADRALFLRARSAHMLHGGNPFSRAAVRRGARHLSPKTQARVQSLQDYSTYLKAAERQLHDGNGLGWTDIMPNNPQYLEAAQRWTGGMLQDSGFRAFLRGREAFEEWFFGTEADQVRRATALAKDETGNISTRLLRGADEAYEGWATVFEKVILKNAADNGVFDDVLNAFKETAAKIDATGGVAHELPTFVFDNLGPIRGVKKNLGARHPVSSMTETFFDTFFMDPVNYRRGLLAEQVRAAETVRLKQLFLSQNKQIIPDLELERVLGMKGIKGGSRSSLKSWVYEEAFERGYVPEGYIADLVESTVEKEIDNMLYTWDKSSRLGAASQAAFPFGKPWADMAGFWGREVMRKPMLRGTLNESNFLGIRTMYDNLPMPFNPKPAAMMSRLAHTDFTIDKGIHPSLPGSLGEGGLLPGSDETDFSPVFFLPTGGDNPFGAIIPGLGYIPMAFMDLLIERIADPIDDPEGYQKIIDAVGDFIPSVRYQAGSGAIPRLLGGGTMGTIASLAIDAATFKDHNPEFFATSLLGDISRELDRTRELSALLADPEEFEMLLEAETPEEVETLLMALAQEADNRVAGSHALETVSRFIVPASNQYDTALSDIFDVWVEASQSFPVLQVRPSLADADLEDPEIRRQYANDVRRAFFELPTWQRDLYVAMQPSLAVNLVGSWDWTPSAKQAGIEDTDLPYRTGGTDEDLARHQAYIDAGYVRPVVPIERAKRIVGYMQAAKENAAKYIYESLATDINDFIWENVSDDTMNILSGVMTNTAFTDRWAIVDEKDLWDNWSSMEERIEEAYAESLGIEPIRGNEDYDEIRSFIKIPADEKPWGSSWPGLDDDELSQRFRNVQINNFNPEITEIANGLGIDLTPGMTGLELFNGVQEVITEVDTPLFSTVRPAYEHYIGSKGVGSRAADAELAKAKINPDLDEGWRNNLAEWQVRADRLADQWRDEVGGVPLSKAREVAQEFGNLWATSDLNIAWEDIWRHKYERTFGPIEWEAPQPQPPIVDGERQPGVTVPYIKYIPDGDTIVFKERRGAQQLRTVRLLGVNARDYGLDNEGAAADKTRLQDALQSAVESGATIYLVRDPLFGDTDHYGRQLAWLWIGDEPFYFEEEFRSTVTPSEADR
jgi:hypothetical protein